MSATRSMRIAAHAFPDEGDGAAAPALHAAPVTADAPQPYIVLFERPDNIVTSTAGTAVTFALDVSGMVGSEIRSGSVTLDHPLDTPDGPVSTIQFTGGTAEQLLATLNVTSGTASGVYTAVAASVTDTAGNTHSYDAAALQGIAPPFTVDDHTVPVLTALSIGPVDVTNQDANVTVSGSASDGASNIQSITLTLDKPVSVQGYQGHGVSTTYPSITIGAGYPYGVPETGSFSSSLLLDRTTKAGDYTILSAVVTDKAGNSSSYSTADLAALGFTTQFHVTADTTPPVLTALTIPDFSDPNSATYGQLSLTGSDTGSANTNLFATVFLDHGIGSTGFPSVQLNVPVSSLIGTNFDALNSNHPSAITLSPSLLENPSYNITSVQIADTAGNEVDYTADQLRAMGFETHFVTDAAAFFQAGADNETMIAPFTGNAYFQGDGRTASTVVLNGNIQDYTLSRLQPSSLEAHSSQVGAYILTATNGSGSFTIEESVGGVHFVNGQYLSTHDLPAYIGGDTALLAGGDGHDDLFQNPAKAYQLFIGGGGHDDVYLNGNVGDYTLRHFDADTALRPDGGSHASGLELVARNGSGALFVSDDIDTIHFKDGQYLSFGDVGAYVAADPSHASDTVALAFDNDPSSVPDVLSTPGQERALVNGNAGDYSVSRVDYDGDYVLTGHSAGAGTIELPETVSGVQFANGQFLSPQDLSAYMSGSDVYTFGSFRDDLLTVPFSGDQYIYGFDGNDNLFIHGNTHDYTIALTANANGENVVGYELIANNGSGNLYIDQSVETVHFQDGQYLAFHDLTAYITPLHG